MEGPQATERSLKIYFVSQGYPPADTAGIARWTQECALELTTRGHEVHVITRSHSRGNHVDYLDGVWVHSVIDAFDEELTHISPVPLPPSIARRATAVLREIMRSETIWGVDIVSAPIWDVEGILCCAHLTKPVVTSLHTTYKLAMRFKSQWNDDIEYKTKHVNKVIVAEAWLMERSCAILANSQQVISEIDENYDDVLGRRAERITTVLHGIGSPVDKSAKSGLQNASPRSKATVLFVGRLGERKGPDQILSALAKIPSSLDKLEMIFIGSQGSDSDPYRVKLAKQAGGLKSTNPRLSLKFLGYLNDVELQEHYSNADVFIAPSRFESFGLVLIEAMRHGLPVIGCDVGGMREIITDGVDGFLVSVDDPEQLAGRIKTLAENPGVRKQIGDAARKTYESRFTGSKMAESIERMFCKITQEFVHG
jgi:glycogen synthase